MFNITKDIQSLTDFKNNTPEFIKNLKKTGRPTVLTVNGKAELVVMDAKAYHKMQEKLEMEESIREIEQSMEDYENGDFVSAEEAFDILRKTMEDARKQHSKKLNKIK